MVRREKPWGVIVQFGGQTPLKLAAPSLRPPACRSGHHARRIDLAEDRERFGALLA
jgi:carbamoyl-phosphate synthase large subunit